MHIGKFFVFNWSYALAAMVSGALIGFTAPAQAQETIFNAPNGEITQMNSHYVQVQGATDFPDTALNITYDYGLFSDLEIGFNVFDVSSASAEDGGKSTDYLINGQWFYEFNEFWTVSIGGQFGLSQEEKFSSMEFLNIRHEFFKDAFLTAGVFEANDAYMESGSGFWYAGMEFPLIHNAVMFEAEYINGNSKISNGVVGLGTMVSDDIEATIGLQISGIQANNDIGAIFEITKR